MEVIDKILSLNRGVTKFGLAPHKPVLLLAVIDSIENGEITENRIEITDDLLRHFYDNWNLLVKTNNSPNFSLPFFHLKNEKSEIWNLITVPGKEIPTTKSKSIKSFKALNDTVQAATLSEDLFDALTRKEVREEVKKAILRKYFGVSSQTELTGYKTFSESIEEEMLGDPYQNYARRVNRKIQVIPEESKEEILILRSSIFRRIILGLYNNQCSVSGLKVGDINRTSMVDACHIIPFSETNNDSVRNGIALSPTFHRAFDRGIIAVSDNYTVMVNAKLKDYKPESGIRQYENQKIYLPVDERYWPSPESLSLHRKKFGFS
jgi:putative restriction endonuclease